MDMTLPLFLVTRRDSATRDDILTCLTDLRAAG